MDQKNTKIMIKVAVLPLLALLFAGGLAIAFPLLSSLDPVSHNIISYRMRNKFCEPLIQRDIDCLKACIPSDRERKQACEAHNDADLAQTSPCAQKCRINWKTQSLWCDHRKGEQKALLDGTEACVYEGAVIALIESKETSCLSSCPSSRADDPLFMTAGDTCMIDCMEKAFVKAPVSNLWRDLRESCRLAHPRALHTEPLKAKQVKERAFADCVLKRLL